MASVEVVGGQRLISRIHRLEAGIPRAAARRTIQVAERIRDTYKKNAPVGTPQSTGIPGYVGGSLKKSARIQRVATRARRTIQVNVLVGGRVRNPNTGKLVDYAVHVERGTSRMKARPVLRQAIAAHEHELAEAIKEDIKE